MATVIEPESPSSTHAERPVQGLFASLRIVSLYTFASRILGLVRDVGMAGLFGNGPVMDAFSIAFKIPNLARRLFGEGALTTAFLPLFIRELEHAGRPAAWQLASSVLTVFAVVLSGLVIVLELLLLSLTQFTTLGPEAELLVGLTAVLLPYLVFICLSAQVGAILHGLGHFTWPALLPIVLNAVWIAAIWLVAPQFVSSRGQAFAISVCIVASGVLQLLAPLPALYRLGFRYETAWRSARGQVREIVRVMLPIILGLSVTQLNTIADSLIAWGFSRPAAVLLPSETGGPHPSPLPEGEGARGPHPSSLPEGEGARGSHPVPFPEGEGMKKLPLEAGTASALYFGQRMYQFPLGVFGVALGTVLFPLLARHAGTGRLDRLRDDLSLGMRLVIVIGLPASAGLMLLAQPLTKLLFQHGAFDADDALQTADMIRGYGVGVWAYCALLTLHRGFYALGDQRTPLLAGVGAMLLNLALNFTLIWPLGGWGLALATSVAAIVQTVAIAVLLNVRVGRLHWRSLMWTTLKSMVAVAAMSAVCRLTMDQVETELSASGTFGETTVRALAVLIPLCASIVTYVVAARVLRMSELRLLFDESRGTEHPR